MTQWMPQGKALGTIVFSHGANLAPLQYLQMIEPLAASGWRVLAPLHTDSEQHADKASYTGFATWSTRLEDMQALSAHIGEGAYVAAGHSYGALTALVLGGAQALVPKDVKAPLADPKVKAVLAFSPPPPIPGFVDMAGYAKLQVPALIQTGTFDVPLLPGSAIEGPNAGYKGHLAPYNAAAKGGARYALTLEGVDHYYGGAIGRLKEPSALNQTQLRETTAITQSFLDAHMLGSSQALAALQSKLSNDLPVVLQTK
ncbi:MAG: hypothetical protein ABJ242_00575 [Marinomonas sp.]